MKKHAINTETNANGITVIEEIEPIVAPRQIQRVRSYERWI